MLTLVTEGSDALTSVNLSFAYPGHAPLVRELSLQLPRGSRCLLCGANGGGACEPGAKAERAQAAPPHSLTPPRAQASRLCSRCLAGKLWWTGTQFAFSASPRSTPPTWSAAVS